MGKFFELLSNNLNELLKNSDEYNVIIEVGQEPNIKAFKAHSIILSSQCLYFKDKLAAITYNDNNIKIIKQTNVSIEVFEIIINLNFKKKSNRKILEPTLWDDIMLKPVAPNKAITITSHVLPSRTNLSTTLPSRDIISDNYASEIIDPTIANKFMPDDGNLGYEIEDFQYYTWRITGWNGLEKRITSPEFAVGGWKWRILLFPLGNEYRNSEDNVSIYLDFADPKGAPAGWHSCVQFALLLWNPEDQTSNVSHTAHHRFTAEESDWGFTRFYNLHKLFAPSENLTRPLIENDACNITAFVRILRIQLIVTPDIFARYKWFDLANSIDWQYPLFDVPQFMVRKSETYNNFKDLAAKHLGYPAEQIRFWIFCDRANKTMRPDTPIPNNFFSITMEEIHTKMAIRHDELKLFLEVAKPINGKVVAFNKQSSNILNFVFAHYINCC
ncbi:TRAF-like protein [Gigaspora rosea]|uniref:TRAF-like protein n=1 Tax=Gigaspora rosea TaxID=44941 RepID=A0A397UN18_9GLOM|nr:TRAF-like protein [Gigaspora rosea]